VDLTNRLHPRHKSRDMLDTKFVLHKHRAMKTKLRNVTVTLEEDVARWARIEAARNETSVSRLLGAILKERMLHHDGYERAMRRALARLFSRRRADTFRARRPMTAPVFVDTNVFLYALDRADLKKQIAARKWRDELWKNRLGRISFQVLQEFYVKASQKWPESRDEPRAEVRDLLAWRPVTEDAAILERGWKVQDRYHLSFGDALIVAAAKSIGCRYLLTEDLQADQNLDGIIVVSPFLADPASLSRD
jgi:predicted nucleic acid-binding protein